MKKSVYVIILLAGLFIIAPFVAAAGALASPNLDLAHLISALQGQVDLLKWIGGAVVSGLAIAVTTLFFALQKSQGEVKIVAEKNVVTNDKLADAVNNLSKELGRRPCLKE